jgi:2-polyprenyl-3-methyl-5-hydroxy-6-metoxy-1,4-benzoquinol methylase
MSLMEAGEAKQIDSSAHPGAETVRRFLRELASDGVAALGRYFAPDVIWHVGPGHKDSGTHYGLETLCGHFDHQLSSRADVTVKSLSVLADDAYGAVLMDVATPVDGSVVDFLMRQLFRVGSEGLWSEYWFLEPVTRTPPMPATREEIEASVYFNQYWYYCFELLPGLFTPGEKHPNLGLTRDLLSRCEVAGRKCLDIGTMEGAVPVLLSCRGAGTIAAVDVMECGDKIELVKRHTGAEFNYHSSLNHFQTVPFLQRRYSANFDVVVFSGVLYHCMGPIHALGMARSLVRTGGLMIVETLAAIDERDVMFFNSGGAFYPDPSTYFAVSVPLFDYLLRLFKLLPIDCAASRQSVIGGRQLARVAVTCRAINEIPVKGDPWIEETTKEVDYRTLVDWEAIDRSGSDPPAYGRPASRFVDPVSGSCDVTRTVMRAPPMALPEQVAIIALEDLY